MIGSHSEEIPVRIVPHGCGPGVSVPAGTVQEGVRGPVPGLSDAYRRLASEYQKMADLYNRLADIQGRG